MSESRNILTHLQIYIFLISQKNEEIKIKKERCDVLFYNWLKICKLHLIILSRVRQVSH